MKVNYGNGILTNRLKPGWNLLPSKYGNFDINGLSDAIGTFKTKQVHIEKTVEDISNRVPYLEQFNGYKLALAKAFSNADKTVKIFSKEPGWVGLSEFDKLTKLREASKKCECN